MYEAIMMMVYVVVSIHATYLDKDKAFPLACIRDSCSRCGMKGIQLQRFSHLNDMHWAHDKTGL